MTQAPPFVDFIRDVAHSTPRAKSASPKITVSFTKGAVVQLDSADPRERVWGEVLDSLRASRSPAYVQLDARSGRITSLLLPQEYKVVEIRQPDKGGDLLIEFDRSQALHTLRRAHPHFKELRKLLEASAADKRTLLVTDSLDTSALLDVRPVNSK